jgi:hypothetical protein
MWDWLVLIAAITLLLLLSLYLAMRWGPGARGGRFRDPKNETQNTTPWKMWPF